MRLQRIRRYALPAVLLAVAVAASACGGATGTSGGSGEAAPIRIGVVASITGPASSLGEPQRNTVQLYQDAFSEVNGHPVEWIVRDSKSDPTQVVTETKQLIEGSDVAAVVCCTTSPNSMAILDVVQDAGVVNISMAAAATVVEPVEERTWTFKTAPNDSLVVQTLTDFMVSQGIGKVAFLQQDDAFGESGFTEFERAAGDKGITVTGKQVFARDAQDVTAQITQLREADPDAYLVWAIPPGADVAAKNIRDLGIETPVYQSHGVANQAFIQLGGDAVEGTYFPSPKLLIAEQLPEDDPQRSVLLDYKQTYNDEHGENAASIFGGNVYDAMLILEDAIARAVDDGADPGALSDFRSTLRDEVEATSELVGAGGIFSFAPDDHAGLDDRAVVMVQIADGGWNLVSR